MAYLPMYVAQALVGFGAVIVFTRILSPADYGRYMMAIAAAALIGTLVFTWLDAAIARYHARAKARGLVPGHLFTAFQTYAALSLLAITGVAVLVATLPVSSEIKTLIGFCSVYAITRAGVTLCLEVRRAAAQAVRFAMLETLSTLLGFSLAIALVLLTDLGPAAPFLGMALAGAAVLLIDAPVLLSQSQRDRGHKTRQLAFFAFGAPVAVSLIFEGLITTGDRFIIAALMNEAATGAYAASYAIADRSISIVFLWLGSAIAPLLVIALESEGRVAAQDTARKSAALMGLIGFPAATGLALIAEPAAQLLIGAELQSDAAQIIPFIALSGLMNGVMTFYFHEAFTLGRQPRTMAFVMAGSAILNLTLNIILIPVFGLIGAALATVIAYGVALTICVVVGRQVFPLPIPAMDWTKAALACTIMAVSIITLPELQTALIRLPLEIIVGAGAYGITALALNIANCRATLTS
jgi:O-antigen/teichoic acid export membrane protein